MSRKQHSCCESNLPSNQGLAHEGDRFTCPICKTAWVHVCHEDEGCYWTPLVIETIGGRR